MLINIFLFFIINILCLNLFFLCLLIIYFLLNIRYIINILKLIIIFILSYFLGVTYFFIKCYRYNIINTIFSDYCYTIAFSIISMVFISIFFFSLYVIITNNGCGSKI